jgi:hypothetical protein
MKHLLFVLICLPIFAHAQIKKGSYFLQASISLQTNSNITMDSKGTTSDISSTLPLTKLGIGKFVNNKHAFCLFILGSVGSNEIVGEAKNYTFGLGASHTYVYAVNDQWGLLLNTEVNGRYGQSSSTKKVITGDDYMQKLSIWNAQFSPGIYYVFFNKIWVQANIDWLSLSHINIENNPNLPVSFSNQASRRTLVEGLFPGTIDLSNIHIKLSYLIH